MQRETASSSNRTTREDWLREAVKLIVSGGIDQVKVQVIARKLGVSRSSFYWFFKSRQDLLDQLLEHWRSSNTRSIVERAERPAASACRSVLNVFECWVNQKLFDPRLDIAVRDWARRSPKARAAIDAGDEERMQALTRMFERHGYPEDEAFIRARVLYFMQIGYYSLDIEEPMETRLSYLANYLRSFTGLEPTREEIQDFHAFLENGATATRRQ